VSIRYEPANNWQGTDGARGWVSCGAFSAATIVDAVSLGGCTPTGHDVRDLTNEIEPEPDDPGLTIPQIAAALRRFGCVLEDRTRKVRRDALADLKAGRYLSASVWYSALGTYRSQKGDTDWGHQVTLGRIDETGTSVKLYDPLSRVKTGRWIPLVVAFGAMEAWGRESNLPTGQMRYARSRPIPFLATA
jgi:hypothetical protein